MKESRIKNYLLVLILVSTLGRAVLASLLELGNDEVYYRLYALYPALSHFDHPPMVGLVMRLFSLNLHLHSEFFLRLAAIVFGSLSTWLIYLAGKTIKDALTGWYAAILYTASIYAFIISGTFILPDSPQVFFWVLSLYIMALIFKDQEIKGRNKWLMLALGASIGLGMISKYTSVFLWLGIGLYILFYQRRWFKEFSFYGAILISALIFLPVIIWNVQNQFISFTFHSDRLSIFGSGIRPDYFLTELLGEIGYNNPVNWGIAFAAIWTFFRRRKPIIEAKYGRLILFLSLPLIILFLFFSLFRPTLPHWTGPAYVSLLLLSASYLSFFRSKAHNCYVMPIPAGIALGLTLTVSVLGVWQVNKGIFYNGKEKDISLRGEKDISLDMYGWEQIGKAFEKVTSWDVSEGTMPAHAPIISYRWFPAANQDYYLAEPAGTYTLAIGPLDRIHKYAWINHDRGGFHLGMDAYYITTSRDFASPESTMKTYFQQIIPRDTIPVIRGGKIAEYAFIYQLKGLEKIPEDDLKDIR